MNEILTIDAASYHADPCERPSLSASIATILCAKSPLHAWTAHPRLNPAHEPAEAKHFDVGSAAHLILLEGHADRVVVVDAKDWKSKAAQQARSDAYEVDGIPLLDKDWARVQAMVAAARVQIDAFDVKPPLLTDGEPEQTLLWEDDRGVLCRSRADWLRHDLAAIDDYKTTTDARAKKWMRKVPDYGYDVQAAFYLRGVQKITGERPSWRWIAQEKTPPYALSVVVPGADVLAVAEEKVKYALRTWAACLESGVWPSYSLDVATAELPAWSEDAAWLVDEAAA